MDPAVVEPIHYEKEGWKIYSAPVAPGYIKTIRADVNNSEDLKSLSVSQLECNNFELSYTIKDLANPENPNQSYVEILKGKEALGKFFFSFYEKFNIHFAFIDAFMINFESRNFRPWEISKENALPDENRYAIAISSKGGAKKWSKLNFFSLTMGNNNKITVKYQLKGGKMVTKFFQITYEKRIAKGSNECWNVIAPILENSLAPHYIISAVAEAGGFRESKYYPN